MEISANKTKKERTKDNKKDDTDLITSSILNLAGFRICQIYDNKSASASFARHKK